MAHVQDSQYRRRRGCTRSLVPVCLLWLVLWRGPGEGKGGGEREREWGEYVRRGVSVAWWRGPRERQAPKKGQSATEEANGRVWDAPRHPWPHHAQPRRWVRHGQDEATFPGRGPPRPHKATDPGRKTSFFLRLGRGEGGRSGAIFFHTWGSREYVEMGLGVWGAPHGHGGHGDTTTPHQPPSETAHTHKATPGPPTREASYAAHAKEEGVAVLLGASGEDPGPCLR